jgi:hypothetical protein
VGFCRIFKHFSGFGFFLLSGIFHARPQTTNANRWVAFLQNKVKTVLGKLCHLHITSD